MDKKYILEEIKRTAQTNDGRPLGSQRFRGETGIKVHEWGKFWRCWGDALIEAGFAPNQFQAAFDKGQLLRQYAEIASQIGRLPSDGDLRIRHAADSTFPDNRTYIVRFGGKAQLIQELAEFCREQTEFPDVLLLCESYQPRQRKQQEDPATQEETEFGYVYLMKSGRHYKIGKTNAAGRRERELAIQLPEKAKTVHVISTDDPAGIEAYWHRRFESKRQNGEWFDLSASDVSAFKRRKFM